MSDEVRLERQGALALITLDRPKALNALTLEMIRAIAPALAGWAADPGVRAVVIRGAGDRAFCAGGDVRAVYEDGLMARQGAGAGVTRDFFREEYRLNARIHAFPKPFVALLDGISMGGGLGLSVHGSHRVATERLTFAMPETGIGLFPDIGGGWFLPRWPGETGTCLALAGLRGDAADALHVGYATHAVPHDRRDAVLSDLAESLDGAALDGAAVDGAAGGSARAAVDAAVDAVLARHAADPGPSPLAAQRDAIDRCFGADTVEGILAALDREGSGWAAETASTIRRMSPTSLKVALRQLRLGRTMPYAACVTMEYRLSQACMAGHDFYEGIRAVLVDRDRAPRWRPGSLAEVTEAAVERHFEPLGPDDLFVDDDPAPEGPVSIGPVAT